MVECPPDEEFATNSCLIGCGGVSGYEFFHAELPTFIKEQGLHINALESLHLRFGV